MPSRARVQDLIDHVENGRFIEAIETFYAHDATMQENQRPPRTGLAALVEGEKGVLAAFASVRALPSTTFVLDGDVVVIHWLFEFVHNDGRSLRQDELAWQVWLDNKIVEERFYYDPAQIRPARAPS